MSVIRKKPFIESVVDSLSMNQKDALRTVMNSAGNNVSASLLEMPAKGITPVLFKLDEANVKTGILIYTDSYCVLIAYHRFQDLLMFELYPNSTTYKKINEYLDINELRRLLTVGDDVTAGEIDSGDQPANKVLASDGEGGAEWTDTLDTITPENVEEGDAVQLFGFDSEGHLVKDNIPEGILVDETIIEDSPNAVAGGAVYDLEQEVNKKANKDGNYQTMTVGLANNFDTKLTENDQSAYNFRPTATMGSVELEVGSPCKVKKIVGGTIVFNQKVYITESTFTKEGIDYVCTNSTGSVKCSGTSTGRANSQVAATRAANEGDKLLISGTLSSFSLSTSYFALLYQTGSSVYISHNSIITDTVKACPSETKQFTLEVVAAQSSGQTVDFICYPQIFNLTQMFGSTIANYIYTLETATPGAGVAWFRRYFNKPYYAYDGGHLISVKTNGRKVVGFNQWDEETEIGGIDPSTGENTGGTTLLRSKNYIPALPNTVYYFKFNEDTTNRVFFYDANKNYLGYEQLSSGTKTTPSNCGFMRFRLGGDYGTTYNHDICINFHYDGERDGEYEPYETETYAMEDAELRGVPKLDSNNNLVFNGDEYLPDGTENVRYGIINLGTLTYSYESSPTTRFLTTSLSNLIKKEDGLQNVICPMYRTAANYNDDMTLWVSGGGNISIHNNNYTDAAAFKTAMNGVYLVYELATPTTAALEPFPETQECDNWGTEQFLPPENDTRPCEVPVGHDTDYLPDLKAKLESAPTTPSENGYYVLQHNESAEGNPNAYAEMNTVLAAEGYEKNIAARVNMGGILRHMLTGVDFANTAYIDMGELTYVKVGNRFEGYFGLGKYTANAKPNIICPLYETDTWPNVHSEVKDKTITIIDGSTNAGKLAILDSSFTGDATAFKEAMKGVLLAYEKASE